MGVNAKYGAKPGGIYKQRACSDDSQCKWSIVNDAPCMGAGGSWETQMRKIIDRELGSGKKVILVGYPQKADNAHGGHGSFMDRHKALASEHDNVWFIDPRDNDLWQKSWDYYAKDKRHPSAGLGGLVFAEDIAKVVRMNS